MDVPVRAAVPAADGDGRRRGPWLWEAAEVVAQEPGGPGWQRLVLSAPAIAARAVPGQFAQVAVRPQGAGGPDPLLPRPLSFCTLGPERISFLYRVVGRGTALLSAVRPGQRLGLLGPLGRSFPDPGRHRDRPLLLVGGGLGIPPLACAGAWAAASGRRPAALLGARTAGELAGAEEVAAAGIACAVATDDGSAGRRGAVTALLEEAVEAGAEVWACGPAPMLAAVERVCADRGAEAWLCIERPMACGFGVCLGCAVPAADGSGYLRACVDGPVFRAGSIDVLGS